MERDEHKITLSFGKTQTAPEKDYVICAKFGDHPQISIDGKVIEVRSWEKLTDEEKETYEGYSRCPTASIETKDHEKGKEYETPFIGCLMGCLTFFYSDNRRAFPHLRFRDSSGSEDTTLETRVLMSIFGFFVLRLVQGGVTRGKYSFPLSTKYTVSMGDGMICLSIPTTKFEYFFTLEDVKHENFDEGIAWLSYMCCPPQ
jgi:hypothetical protein